MAKIIRLVPANIVLYHLVSVWYHQYLKLYLILSLITVILSVT